MTRFSLRSRNDVESHTSYLQMKSLMRCYVVAAIYLAVFSDGILEFWFDFIFPEEFADE